MFSTGVFVLFTCLIIAPVAESSDEGSCLLAKRKNLAKVLSLAQHTVVHRAVMHRAWRLRHEELQRATNASKNALDEAVANNAGNSDDACAARVNESKKMLDDLIDDVKDLNDQVQEKQRVLETEAEALEEVEEAVKAVKDKNKDLLEKCEEQKKQAISDLAKYAKQQEELDAIAVASKGAGPVSLLSEGVAVSFDRPRCLAFVQYARRVALAGVQAPSNETCDERREKLQEDFEEAHEENQKLIETAKDRAEDPSCKDAADAKKQAALAPLEPQQEEAAKLGDKAQEEIANLKPVLEETKGRADKLKDHIDKELKPECDVAEKVEDTLESIRDELKSLEDCPTKEDWELKVPGEEASTNAQAKDETDNDGDNNEGDEEEEVATASTERHGAEEATEGEDEEEVATASTDRHGAEEETAAKEETGATKETAAKEETAATEESLSQMNKKMSQVQKKRREDATKTKKP